ncbi:helix-turn-helix transcriptional regulator [Micromonospora sp. WMMD987]|uniref:helix-turn-helix domain-containing protein n=1 Tax=Micromonospora sp. WMMD987 TaxID=3016089 RepID=UPI00249B19FE|nr:helix-turn-helix transcriptional regulator [Micromonospora sp. WMMD987]WFE95791.1 helix-turn-helix transcriptional regulator [Micromonospora sp. WMMD987]
MVFATLEVDVARATGPTIARWQLGRELHRLREAAGVSHKEIATELGCSESKIYKIESGVVGVSRADVIVMLTRYGVGDDRVRQTALDLQRQGKERGWWAKFGQLPNPYSMYIGLESAATAVRNFELAVVPGLLQTEAYAYAITSAAWPGQSEEARRRVAVRMTRQDCLTDEPVVKLWAIVDEGVLHRQTGGPEVMRAQLHHLIEMSDRPNIELQVLPFGEGWHPGTVGSFSILEFPEDIHSPVVYVVSQAGDAYLEREDDLRRVTLTYTHLHAAALSASKSRDLIAAIAKDMT